MGALHITETVNTPDAEDTLKYLPGIFLSKRNPGDTQAVIGTRVWGVSSSARSCMTETAATKPAGVDKRHPLRGVVTAVYADRSSLMVKHEEIPGVMRAMTMLFKVDEATLKAAQKGQRITAMMSRQGDDWWLHEVKTEAAPPR
ncbi:MAG: copper-binding protein [Opitutaceae bacterium]